MVTMTRRALLAVLPLLLAACGSPSPAQQAKDGNQLACNGYREHVSAVGGTFTDLSKGTIAIADALPPIRKAQQKLTEDASLASGPLASNIQGLADDFGKLRVEMGSSGDAPDSLTTSILKAIDPIDAACKAIGH